MNLKEIASHLQEFKSVCVTGNPVMLRNRTDFLDIISAYGLTMDMNVSKKDRSFDCVQRLNAKENRQSGCPEYSNRFGAAMV